MNKILLIIISFFTISAESQSVALQTFATGFSSPVEMARPANDTRFFVVQRGGIIRILNSNGTVNSTPFLTLSSIIVSGGERGLLGMAFHPNYANNGYFYVNYTRSGDGATVIARYTVSSDPDVANPASAAVLMTIPQPFSNHNGGSIKFGPDGYLYIGMGDGGSAGDPGNRAQNINDNLGKMLRIDVDAASPYGIPPTNPYLGIPGNDEIWAIGLRNPWKFSFNRVNGDLWIADVGQSNIEEVDKVSSPLPNTGLNFGWRCYEGTANYNTAGCPPITATVQPFAQYSHGATGGCSVTGGYFYTGNTYPNFQNKYFLADYCNNKIGLVDSNGVISWSNAFSGNGFSTFGEDINGELYIAGLSSGTIYKIYDSLLSVQEFSKKGISLYPNPASTEVSIRNTSGNPWTVLKIYDLSGKLLVTETSEVTDSITLGISGFEEGIYLVVANDSKGNEFRSKLNIKKK